MANTEALLGLIDQYTEAFADPEATPEDPTLPDMPEPDEEGRTGESPQDELTVDSGVIEFEQESSRGSAPVFDLPETHARAQTEGCASGMCPADH